MVRETAGTGADTDINPPRFGGSLRLGWTIWGLAALFYCFEFFIRISPGVLVQPMMREFGADAASLGNLSAFYFYAYAAMQIPVGLILDRFGPSRALSAAAAIYVAGNLLLGLAPSLAVADLGRLIGGLSGAMGFLGALALGALWLPPQRLGLVTGLTMAAGTVGAIVSQAPLALLVDRFGWHHAMLGAAGFGLVLAAVLWLLLRDPDWFAKRPRHHRHGVWRSLIAVLRDRQMWMIAVVAASSSAPALAFGGLWSLSYLTEVQHLTRPHAALINSLLLGGWALGGSGLGWISDRLGRRKGPLLGVLTLGFAVWAVMPFLPPVSAWLLGPIYVLLGVAGGSLMAAFALSQEVAPPRAGNTASGVVNTLNIGIAAAMQPLFGWILDNGWQGHMAHGIRLYGAADFSHAMLLFPLIAAIGFVAALGIRETYCRRLHAI